MKGCNSFLTFKFSKIGKSRVWGDSEFAGFYNFQTIIDTNSKIFTGKVKIKIRKFAKFGDCTSNSFIWATV